MFWLILVLLVLISSTSYQIVFAINCGSSDRTPLPTTFFNYTSDIYYSTLNSISQTKKTLPDLIYNQLDRQLIKTHRTISSSYSQFSYLPIIDNGYYTLIITMIQTQYKLQGQRIFKIKLGDQPISTIDLISQIGFGQLLHKIFPFDLKQDVVFVNNTPILNAYNFKTHELRITFEQLINKPKIQALIMIKGNDSTIFLKSFLKNQQDKNNLRKQFISEKYRRQPKSTYKTLHIDDLPPYQDSQIFPLANRYLILRTLGCILCGLIAIEYQKITNYLLKKTKFYTKRQLIKFLKKFQ